MEFRPSVKAETDYSRDYEPAVKEEIEDYWNETKFKIEENDDDDDGSSMSESELDFDISQIAPLTIDGGFEFPDHFYKVPSNIDHEYCMTNSRRDELCRAEENFLRSRQSQSSCSALSGTIKNRQPSLRKSMNGVSCCIDKSTGVCSIEGLFKHRESADYFDNSSYILTLPDDEPISDGFEKIRVAGKSQKLKLKAVSCVGAISVSSPSTINKRNNTIPLKKITNGRNSVDSVIDGVISAIGDRLHSQRNKKENNKGLEGVGKQGKSRKATLKPPDAEKDSCFSSTSWNHTAPNVTVINGTNSESEKEVDIETVPNSKAPIINRLIDDCLGLISDDEREELYSDQAHAVDNRTGFYDGHKGHSDTSVATKRRKAHLKGRCSEDGDFRFTPEGFFRKAMKSLKLSDKNEKKKLEKILKQQLNYKPRRVGRPKDKRRRDEFSHNALERLRRTELAEHFKRLKNVIPNLLSCKNASKLQILREGRKVIDGDAQILNDGLHVNPEDEQTTFNVDNRIGLRRSSRLPKMPDRYGSDVRESSIDFTEWKRDAEKSKYAKEGATNIEEEQRLNDIITCLDLPESEKNDFRARLQVKHALKTRNNGQFPSTKAANRIKRRKKKSLDSEDESFRVELAQAFIQLRDVMPELRSTSAPKIEVLLTATFYCQLLQLEGNRLALQKTRLTNEMRAKKLKLYELQAEENDSDSSANVMKLKNKSSKKDDESLKNEGKDELVDVIINYLKYFWKEEGNKEVGNTD